MSKKFFSFDLNSHYQLLSNFVNTSSSHSEIVYLNYYKINHLKL